MKFNVYQGEDDQWYWRLTARNGKVIADSGEGFVRQGNALRSAERLNGLLRTKAVIKVSA